MSNTSLLGAYAGQGGDGLMFRNRIINGDMRISQRGTSFVSPANVYTLDRFLHASVSSATLTINQSSDVPNSAFSNSLHVDVTATDTAIAASDFVSIRQYIEGYNVADLVGTTFTLSFWVKSSKTGVHCVGFRNSAPDRSYVAEYTVTSANTWEYKTITVANGLPASGTWNFTNGLGLSVIWTLMAGINTQTTPNAWQTGNFFATSAQVNCVDDAANNFYLTGVQLEAGPVATPFERRPLSLEVQLAQRYFQVVNAPQYLMQCDANQFYIYTASPVKLRASPSTVKWLTTAYLHRSGEVSPVTINTVANTTISPNPGYESFDFSIGHTIVLDGIYTFSAGQYVINQSSIAGNLYSAQAYISVESEL